MQYIYEVQPLPCTSVLKYSGDTCLQSKVKGLSFLMTNSCSTPLRASRIFQASNCQVVTLNRFKTKTSVVSSRIGVLSVVTGVLSRCTRMATIQRSCVDEGCDDVSS